MVRSDIVIPFGNNGDLELSDCRIVWSPKRVWAAHVKSVEYEGHILLASDEVGLEYVG